MEVSSSTAASSLQDDNNDILPHTAIASATSSVPVVSTSWTEAEGQNNVASSEVHVDPVEGPVRYGPFLPTGMYSTESVNNSKDIQDSKAVPGSCGLYNLGNTCFMNAGLQSLISCAPLVKFFCESYTLTDANKHTLTGHFYMLLCKMWSGHFSVVYPRKFKEFLAFYHSQFEDYRQHDCQEFLALLLDTLHEQLNSAPAANKRPPLVDSSSCPLLPALVPESHSSTTTICKSQSLDTIKCIGDGDDDDDDDDDNITNDLNNKDSVMTMIVGGDSDCIKSTKYLNLAESGIEGEQDTSFPNEGSPTSESSVLDALVTSPSNHGDVCQKSPEEENDIISSSFPPLRRYTSRPNLDDVTSSDSGLLVKPSLKRVSSGNSFSVYGPLLHSEDSNHSTLSAHSTDSEQSSAFKRLKIDSAELNRNSNNLMKDCVTSTSDCKKNARNKKNMLADNCVLKEAEDILVTSNTTLASSHIDANDSMVSSCQEGLCVDVQSPSFDKPESLSPGLPSLDDFYSKETKTLNTNVVSEFLQEITSDSEKFAKLDNRHRPPSKEVNILQEAFGEEDKAEKVLIGHRFGSVKDTNLYAHSSVVKPVKNSDPNVLNNSLDIDTMPAAAISKCSTSGSQEKNLPIKHFSDILDEEEKNIQMQAYAKFNTIPHHSNIRTDLTDSVPDGMEVDEADIDSSDEDEVEIASHTSTVEECSTVPNRSRHCSPSEVMMANKAWDEYLSKNDSIIVSTFQGQFRSTVVCSECSHVSVTYEPFMYLSLPIPHAMEQQICVVYISQHKPPVRYLLNLLKTDKVGTAKKKLCELIGQDYDNIIMAEVLDSHISKVLENNILLKYVNTISRKIYAFEVICLNVDNMESVSGDHHLNNEESQSLQPAFELPTSSTPDLMFAADSQVSNHSFDSVNVNSPSSRDTLDYVISDSENCEPSSKGEEPPSPYLRIEDDVIAECESTSGKTPRVPWQARDYSRSQHPWDLVSNKDQTVTAPNSILAKDDANVPTSSTARDDMFHSSGFIPADSKEQNKPVEGDAVVNEASSSQTGFFGSSSTRHCQFAAATNNHSTKGSKTVHEADASKSSSFTSTSSAATTVSHQQISSSSSGNTLSCGGSSRNPSRSCPSPDGDFRTLEHETTLMDVAARLEENSDSFLQRPHNNSHHDFYQEGTDGIAETSGKAEINDKNTAGTYAASSWATLPVHNSSTSVARTEPIDLHTQHWKACAICLEDLLDTELLTHVICNGVFCQTCLEMSWKHTADVSAFSCPTCQHKADMYTDFVPLASSTDAKPRIRLLPLSIAYRHNVKDNTGSSRLELFGHPNIVHMPNVIEGEALYSLIDRMVSPLVTSYSIMLTDGQGLACSQCTFSWRCTGCEVAREGEVRLRTSDSLTIHIHDTLSAEQVSDMQFVHEDASMSGLRLSEPTNIMDCFGAFTQSEVLDEHNPWYCPQCEKNQCAKKTMTVWRYPDNLIIHLKRFVFQDLSSTKIDTKVIFPQNGMDVRGFLSGPSSHGLVYDLYSIVCHFGGASAGHYTCYSKHPLTSQWYYYNDESVTAQVPSESEYSSGYVLYYQRQGTAVEFTPPQLSFFDDGLMDSGVPPSSTYFTGANSSYDNSMAVVLFQPTLVQKPDERMENDDADDYDNEKRHSPCDYESLTVHFGSDYSSANDNFGDEEAGKDNETQVAEPDSTLDFYS